MKRISILYFVEKKMMKYSAILAASAAALFTAFLSGCSRMEVYSHGPVSEPRFVTLQEVAQLLSSIPLEEGHLKEVHDAASASASNGYDEEYRMCELFAAPGTGVGASAPTKAETYAHPLRDALREAMLPTKADGRDARAWLDSLALSDVQIYWPNSEEWDGHTPPVITFDPGDGAEQNEGYALLSDGSVKKLMVDEKMADERPVWVVNRNSDAPFKSLELRRREDPDWGNGGGEILVKSPSSSEIKTLVLRSFTAHRQFDTWFAGAAEFFVKMGALEDFTASTEAELRLYEPVITDFMIVVRRKWVGKEIPFNAILVSEWTPQLSSAAFMCIEDDGGSRTSWKCNATVKVKSQSYGVELELPLYSRDDIVWRGSLTRSFIERNSGSTVRLGDVDLVLELI